VLVLQLLQGPLRNHMVLAQEQLRNRKALEQGRHSHIHHVNEVRRADL
jgi:hypothetical protein